MEIYNRLTEEASIDVCNERNLIVDTKLRKSVINTFLLAFVVETLGVCSIEEYSNINCKLKEYESPCEDCDRPIVFNEWEEDHSNLDTEWVTLESECETDQRIWTVHEVCCTQDKIWIPYSICCAEKEKEWIPYLVCCLECN